MKVSSVFTVLSPSDSLYREFVRERVLETEEGIIKLSFKKDGEIYVYTGLVLDKLKNYSFPLIKGEVEIKDKVGLKGETILWKHQKEAIKKFLEYGRGIIKLPPGSGKTLIALYLASLVDSALFLVHKVELLFQTKEKALDFFRSKDICLIWGSQSLKKVKASGSKRLYISSYQTLLSALRRGEKLPFDNIDLLILDEVHHLRGYQFFQLCSKLEIFHRLGLSATPFKGDKEDELVIASVGPVIYEFSLKEAQTDGVVSEGLVVFIQLPSYPRVSGFSWRRSYYLGIVYNNVRNEKIREVVLDALEKGKRVLVLLEWIRHCKIFEKMDFSPYRVEFLYGKIDSRIRNKILNKFRKGEVDAIFATEVLGEGVDIREVEVLVNGGGFGSFIRVIQRAGRGLRRWKSKKLIVDFIDKNNLILYRQSLKRVKSYLKEGLRVEIL